MDRMQKEQEFVRRAVMAEGICDSLNTLENILDEFDVTKMDFNDLMLMDYALWIVVDLAKEYKGDK